VAAGLAAQHSMASMHPNAVAAPYFAAAAAQGLGSSPAGITTVTLTITAMSLVCLPVELQLQ
jgi:hypothetical protein